MCFAIYGCDTPKVEAFGLCPALRLGALVAWVEAPGYHPTAPHRQVLGRTLQETSPVRGSGVRGLGKGTLSGVAWLFRRNTSEPGENI